MVSISVAADVVAVAGERDRMMPSGAGTSGQIQCQIMFRALK